MFRAKSTAGGACKIEVDILSPDLKYIYRNRLPTLQIPEAYLTASIRGINKITGSDKNECVARIEQGALIFVPMNMVEKSACGHGVYVNAHSLQLDREHP
jgi:hypothetical protein